MVRVNDTTGIVSDIQNESNIHSGGIVANLLKRGSVRNRTSQTNLENLKIKQVKTSDEFFPPVILFSLDNVWKRLEDIRKSR